jgi:hypothetical protein
MPAGGPGAGMQICRRGEASAWAWAWVWVRVRVRVRVLWVLWVLGRGVGVNAGGKEIADSGKRVIFLIPMDGEHGGYEVEAHTYLCGSTDGACAAGIKR